MAKYPLSAPEAQVRNCVAQDWFAAYDTTQVLGKIDFAVALPEPKPNMPRAWLLWAEIKRGTAHDIDDSFVQLILTIGRARTFEREHPPRFLGAFDAGRIAFLPYHTIQDVFTINDFNWNVAPNDHNTREFKLLKKRVSGILADQKLTFDYLTDEAELKKFILQNFVRHAKDGVMKIQITKNNFTHIYNRWLMVVKPTIAFVNWDEAKKRGIIDADFFLADLLSRKNYTISKKLNILLQDDHYRRISGTDGLDQTLFSEIGFRDGQKAHTEFWCRYERPPKEEYWDYIVKRRDLLVPQDIREIKGSYFTPRPCVELSQEYIADVLGENWQDEYYIWDCCAGTGNLLAGLVNRNNIWASTLEQQDVNVMLQRIENMKKGLAGGDEGANLFPSHVFQFDFLNDPFTKLPQGLQDIINDSEKRKKLVIYINPPYVEATTSRTVTGTGKNKAGVATQNATHAKYKRLISKAANEVFALFLIRIVNEIPGCVLAEFSKTKHIQAFNFQSFREVFGASLEKAFLVPADIFDNVKGKFPIGFFIWKTGTLPQFEVLADVFGRRVQLMGQKFLAPPSRQSINLWAKEYDTAERDIIGYLANPAPDFQNNKYLCITNTAGTRHINYFAINLDTLIPACVYFAVRQCIRAFWLNDRDPFLFPHASWADDFEFQRDCLVYTLFHGQNRIKSADGVNYWIPYSEDDIGAEDEIVSHFMINILSGKTPLFAPKEEQGYIDFGNAKSADDDASSLVPSGGAFSPESQAVLDSALPLYRYYHSRPDANPNASFYDIRQYFQGVDDKGQMNPTSADEKYNQLLAELRQAQKRLAAKIEEGVYRHGFLE